MPQNKESFVKGFRYRIYPTKQQAKQLDAMFGQCRFVWNRLLGDYKEKYETFLKAKELDPSLEFKEGCSGFDFINKLKVLRNNPEFPWLKETAAQILQYSAKNLGVSFSKFFKGGGYPQFKKKGQRDSFTASYQAGGIKDGKLHLSKFPSLIKINSKHQVLPTDIRELTVFKTPSGKYYVSIIAGFTPEPTRGTGIVGVDLGITHLATLSTGEKIENPRHYLKYQQRLKVLQRRLSKKQKGSKNRNKARIAVAKLHEKIANCRVNFMHQLTTRLVRENQAVGIECLHVKGMVRNRRLSKHIADAAFGMFRHQLTYKAKWSQHCVIIAANRYYASTQICSNCKATPVVKLKLSTRNWTCSHCGMFHDRDTNAGRNLEDTARLWLPMALKASTPVFIAPLKAEGNDRYPTVTI